MSSRLILASASPRRKQILQLLGVSFSVYEPENVNEDQLQREIMQKSTHLNTSTCAQILSMRLAEAKAKEILSEHKDAVVIGADTVVATKESILGKPYSIEHACEMLLSLCGKSHCVLTGVSIQNTQKSVAFYSESIVHFREADAFQINLIQKYVQSGQPMDKAGGYGIQDFGAMLIDSIEGDYYTVMGLPISELARKLYDFGFVATLDN